MRSTFNLIVNKSYEFVEKQQTLLEQLSKETKSHCDYLASIGLADRASHFTIKPFIYQDLLPGTVDVSRFNRHLALPDIVRTFNTEEKNTLFAASEWSIKQQDNEELNRVLDIRLYPAIRQMIKEKEARVFLGSTIDLQAYTESMNETIIIEIAVPSSVKFYIALNNDGNKATVYISNIVSHENLIQQLITLKLAGIDLQSVPILGDTHLYKLTCKEDLLAFEKQASPYLANRNILIIAGCSLEETACSILEQIFSENITKQKFSGSIVSLHYIQTQYVPNVGFIVLNLNYGEICEEQISFILEKFNCIGIFSGSAAGYIPKEGLEQWPKIGDRITIHSAQHYSGETVALNKNNNDLHLHVPTLFLETFAWLKKARECSATTVDVETFYILRAIQNYQQANPHVKLYTDIGVFISDYVGHNPLRSYHTVFDKYALALQDFINQALMANITLTYNNNRLSTPTFSNQYYTIKSETHVIAEEMKKEAVVDIIGKYWDQSEFSKRVHTPVAIGTVENREAFLGKDGERCLERSLHLPIKLPGSEIRIPNEYKHLSEVLQKIFNFEISVNPKWFEKLYCYLTVDCGPVPRSNFQRVPGPHVDGIPRDRKHPEKQLTDHAYLATNALPTRFYLQPFNMDPYDLKKHHFFAIFRALSDESRTITVHPFDIVLMGPYTVHTPEQAEEDILWRVLVRVECSLNVEFDRAGNTINPYFAQDNQYPGYPFRYIPRPIPPHLFVPPEVYLDKPITHKDYSCQSLDQFGRANLRVFYTQNDRYKLRDSEYKDLDLIANNIMNEKNRGIVLLRQGIPHAFCLYQLENQQIKVDTIFTLMNGKSNELMVYMMKILHKSSSFLVIRVNDNNENMLQYFLRAARLAKIEVRIERPIPKHYSDLVTQIMDNEKTIIKGMLLNLNHYPLYQMIKSLLDQLNGTHNQLSSTLQFLLNEYEKAHQELKKWDATPASLTEPEIQCCLAFMRSMNDVLGIPVKEAINDVAESDHVKDIAPPEVKYYSAQMQSGTFFSAQQSQRSDSFLAPQPKI